QSLYTKVYPNLFKGTQTVNHNKLSYTVTFDVQTAPEFDFSDDTAAITEVLQELTKESHDGSISPSDQTILNELLQHVPTFQMHFPKLIIQLESNGLTTDFQLDLHAYALINISDDTANLQPIKIVAESTGNSLQDWFVDNIIIPQIFKLAGSLLQGIQVPHLTFSNVQFSTLAIQIVNRQIVAVSNLISKGSPAFPTGQTFPSSPFFTMLSQ